MRKTSYTYIITCYECIPRTVYSKMLAVVSYTDGSFSKVCFVIGKPGTNVLVIHTSYEQFIMHYNMLHAMRRLELFCAVDIMCYRHRMHRLHGRN